MKLCIFLLFLFNLNLIVCYNCFQIEKLYAPSPSPASLFGESVSVTKTSDLYLFAVGADEEGTQNGAVYIYGRTSFGTTGQTSVNTTKLTSPNPLPNGHYGKSVIITPTTLIVGAPGESSVYIYLHIDNIFTLNFTFTNPSSTSQFGHSISLNDEFLVVGSPGSNEAFIYSVANWTLLHTLTAENITNLNAQYGTVVSIGNRTVAVGSPGDNSVYLYHLGNFAENSTVSLIDQIETPEGQVTTDILNFGGAVMVAPNDSYVVVSAFKEPSSGKDAGAIYFFKKNGNLGYEQFQRYVHTNATKFDHFGESMTFIDQNTIFVSAHKRKNNELTDAGVIYSLNHDNNNHWSQIETITPDDPNLYGWFGWSMASYTDQWQFVVIVGSNQDATQGNNAGSAYLISCSFGGVPTYGPPTTPYVVPEKKNVTGIAVGSVIAAVAVIAVVIVIAVLFFKQRRTASYKKREDL